MKESINYEKHYEILLLFLLFPMSALLIGLTLFSFWNNASWALVLSFLMMACVYCFGLGKTIAKVWVMVQQ